MGHNVEHYVIRLVHTVVAQTTQVAYRVVDVLLRQAIAGIHHLVVQGKLGADESAVQAGRHLEGAGRLGSVAHHTGKSVDHILDGIAHLVVVAADK